MWDGTFVCATTQRKMKWWVVMLLTTNTTITMPPCWTIWVVDTNRFIYINLAVNMSPNLQAAFPFPRGIGRSDVRFTTIAWWQSRTTRPSQPLLISSVLDGFFMNPMNLSVTVLIILRIRTINACNNCGFCHKYKHPLFVPSQTLIAVKLLMHNRNIAVTTESLSYLARTRAVTSSKAWF